MKIYTRKGDSGQTSLIDGDIVNKHNLSVDAYGTIDELNSFLGLLKDYIKDDKIKDILNNIQIKLFSIGSILASGKNQNISEKVKINDIRGAIVADKLLFDIKKQTLKIAAFKDNKINANIKLK